MTPARIIALVLNWCAEHDTAACVESLLSQRDVAVTPLIIDNASPDGSGARLAQRFPGVAFLQTGANLGYAGGNARGIEWALERGADFVFVINDDAIAEPSCLSALVQALEAAPRAAVAAPTVLHDAPNADVVWWAGGRFDAMRALGLHEHYGRTAAELPAEARTGSAPRTVTAFSGCAVLLRSSAIASVGGFRTDFGSYVEDTELGLRLMKTRWTLLHVPSAIAVHKVPYPAPAPTPEQLRLRDRNRRRVAQLHFGAARRAVFWSWFAPTRLAHLLAYSVRGDTKRARAIVRGALGR